VAQKRQEQRPPAANAILIGDPRFNFSEQELIVRKLRGWTQAVMAEKVGIDRSFSADVERGKRNISILNLDVIAKGLGTSLSQLLNLRVRGRGPKL